MDDPRIEELMEFIDSVDGNGEPTALALMARRVESHLKVVEELKEELASEHKPVAELEARASNLSQSLAERESMRDQIQEEAQTAAVKASVASTTARAAALRKTAEEKQNALSQFDKDLEEEQLRYRRAIRALESKQKQLTQVREQISRRMNILDALVQRAEMEWPAHFFGENERMKAQKQRGSAPPRRRRRSGSRRIVMRRKRAS